MVSRCNWFLGMLFLMAAFGSLMNPSPYVAIAVLFFLMGLILLPVVDRLFKQYFKWQIHGGIKTMVILSSLVIICLIVPQVETNTLRLFKNPIAYLEDSLK